MGGAVKLLAPKTIALTFGKDLVVTTVTTEGADRLGQVLGHMTYGTLEGAFQPIRDWLWPPRTHP